MNSIATRTGDEGKTGLMFGGRVSKDHAQIEAVGTLDELSVAMGAVKVALAWHDREFADWVQERLTALMGEVSVSPSALDRYLAVERFAKITPDDVARLDTTVAELEREAVKPARGWAYPGENPLELAYSQARVAARRAERRMVATEMPLREPVRQFINRLSDVLWLQALRAAVVSSPVLQ